MRLPGMLAVGLLACAAAPGQIRAVDPPDFEAAAGEAVDLLQAYLRVDTTNPPGHERLAADFLQEIFESEGIESRVYDLGNGRANILARLPGNGDDAARSCCSTTWTSCRPRRRAGPSRRSRARSRTATSGAAAPRT